MLGGRQLPQAVADELLERRGQGLGALAAVAPHELVDARVALDDLERAALEQRVDHLEEEERVARHPRHELGAHAGDALAHAEPRLDEPHLLVGREPSELDAHEALDERERPILGARDEQREDRHALGALQHLLEELEARSVRPLEAVDHDDERLRRRERAEQVADAGDEQIAAVVRLFFLQPEAACR